MRERNAPPPHAPGCSLRALSTLHCLVPHTQCLSRHCRGTRVLTLGTSDSKGLPFGGVRLPDWDLRLEGGVRFWGYPAGSPKLGW